MNHTSNNDETSAQTETGVSTGFRRDWKDTRYLHGKSLSFRDEQKGHYTDRKRDDLSMKGICGCPKCKTKSVAVDHRLHFRSIEECDSCEKTNQNEHRPLAISYIELNVKCGKSERGPINSNNLERIFKNEFRPDFMDNVKYKSSQLSDTAAGSKKADTAAEDETLVSTPALREAIFQDAGSRTDSEISA